MLPRRRLFQELQSNAGTASEERQALSGRVSAVGVEGEANVGADGLAHLAHPGCVPLRVESALQLEEGKALSHPAASLLDRLLLIENADGHAGRNRGPRAAKELPQGL